MRHGATAILAGATMAVLAAGAPPAWSQAGAGPLVWHGYRIDPKTPYAGIPKELLIGAYPKGTRGDYFVGISSPMNPQRVETVSPRPQPTRPHDSSKAVLPATSYAAMAAMETRPENERGDRRE